MKVEVRISMDQAIDYDRVVDNYNNEQISEDEFESELMRILGKSLKTKLQEGDELILTIIQAPTFYINNLNPVTGEKPN